jgi:hypothetical protein
MNIKSFLASFTAVIIFNSISFALVTANTINAVREKGVLESEDFGVIDEFIRQNIDELVLTDDFSNVSRIRAAITANSASLRDSAQAQYQQQYAASLFKAIQDTGQRIEKYDEDRQFKVTVNLLVLISELNNPHLLNFALERVNDPNLVIRYWAISSISGIGMVDQLNAGLQEYSDYLDTIFSKFKAHVLSRNHRFETTTNIIDFAYKIKDPRGLQLLLDTAALRVEMYMDWSVNNERIDAELLKRLCSRMLYEPGSSREELTASFARLYSVVIQRYIKGREVLSDESKNNLVNVMAEIEDKCISKSIFQLPNTGIRMAISNSDYQGLIRAHDELLGSESAAGKLSEKIEFDYGSDSLGMPREYPLSLSEPPLPAAD